MERLTGNSRVRGHVRLWQLGDALRRPVTDWRHNDVLYDWSVIAGQLLTAGAANYRIAGMFLEFKNVADPDDPVAIPTFDRSGGMSYYDALADSPDTDYLRVPLLTAATEAQAGGGTVLRFFAMSQGVAGAHGKPFSDVDNSKVFGGALVAVVDPADRTRDLVFSRFYLDTDDQGVKLPNKQLGLEWELTLE